MRQELLCRSCRAIQITARHYLAADVQFAGGSDWHHLQPFVKQIQLRVGDGPSDGRQLRPGCYVAIQHQGADHVCLTWSILIIQRAAVELREQAPDVPRDLQLLAGSDYFTQRGGIFFVVLRRFG